MPSLSTARRRLALAAAAAVLCCLPAAAAPAASASTPEELGQPISNYLVLDAVLGKDATGKPLLYGSTYVASNDGVYFVAIDPATGDVVKQIHMADSWGGYHVAASPDGKVWLVPLSPSGTARLWMYDPSTGNLGVAAVAPETGFAFFFGVTVAPWGDVYAGAYPSGKIYQYDPTTRTLTDLGVVVPGNRYPKALIALPGKRLLIGSGAPAHLTVYSVTTGAKTEVLPPRYAGYSFAYNVERVDNNVFVEMVTPDVRLLRFDATNMAFLGEMPSAPGSWGPTVLKVNDHDMYVSGMTDGSAGLYEQDLASGVLTYRTTNDWVGKDAWWVDLNGERGQRALIVLGQPHESINPELMREARAVFDSIVF